MPARPPLPADDLYARLEIPPSAGFEAIEIAWRALLKRHHPDIAGADGLDRAKRINVAHDWLSDPDLRARYDRERHPEQARRRDAWVGRPAWTQPPSPARPAARPAQRRPFDLEETLRRFVDRVGRLSTDELDRLSVAEPRSIAFVASIGRFLPPQRSAALEAVEGRVRAALAADRWAHPATRDAVLAAAHELVLTDFLDEHLSEPFRGRARERLTRAWEASVDQPRYGPNTAAVSRLLVRAGRLTEDEVVRLVRAAGRGRLAPDPWPRALEPDEYEGLRVSAALAARDAADAIDSALGGLDRARAIRARRLVGRAAHAVALRHAFTASEFSELVAPWTAATGDPATGRHGQDERVDPRVQRRA